MQTKFVLAMKPIEIIQLFVLIYNSFSSCCISTTVKALVQGSIAVDIHIYLVTT